MTLAPCASGSTSFDLRTGYKLASRLYDEWHWQGFWRRNELPIVNDWLASLEVGSVLDAGTGTGLYRAAIEGSGHFAIGIDISREMLLVQRESHPHSALVQGSLDAIPFADSSFDHVLCTRVLTHVPVLLPVFAEFLRIMKPGGQVFIADLHPEHPYSKMTIKAKDQRISIQIRKYSVDELKQSLASAGLELLDFRTYTLAEISWKPPRDGFKNIYRDPARPIFYTALLRRP
jgi:ubiquinone/menaquinone biosynthesis C-methylase UbiE